MIFHVPTHHFFFFFFSSRRRHTRLQGDWSSDVCSSDLNDSVGFNGYANLTFERDALTVQYYSLAQHGGDGGRGRGRGRGTGYNNSKLLVTERWGVVAGELRLGELGRGGGGAGGGGGGRGSGGG